MKKSKGSTKVQVVSLNDFVKILHKDVIRFHDMWVKSHLETPENFPMGMPTGEWYEQFRIFND